MSILITGIQMPKTCGDCRFSVDGWCYAFASNEKQPGYITSDEKAKWCPLIEVPPHGDLIDRDALLNGEGRYFISVCREGIDVAEIQKAQTVIPADKDGET